MQHPRNQGIALVTTLIIATLILGILAVAFQTMIGTTQNVQARNVTLQAQYAAESGLNLARSRVQTMFALMSNLTAPTGQDATYITQALRNTCGKLLNYAVTDGSDTCNLTTSASIDSLINDFLARTDFLPARVYAQNQVSNPSTFWQSVLRQSTLTSNTVIGGQNYTITVDNPIQITQIRRTGFDSFEFTLNIPDVTATATAGSGASAAARKQYSWDRILDQADTRMILQSPAFSRWASFTDSQGAVQFDANTNFGGPVHTNGIFNFNGNSTFGGKVTSAGCNDALPRQCSARGNFGTGSTGVTTYSFDGARGDRGYTCTTTCSYLGGTLAHPYNGSANKPTFVQGAAWGVDQIALPTASNQKSIAIQGGIYIPGNAESVTLTTSGGNQFIRVCSPSNVAYDNAAEKSAAGDCQEFRVDVNRTLTLKNSSGVYVNARLNTSTNKYEASPTPTRFNGTLYVDGVMARLRGDGNATTPDIGRNAQLTISTKANIRITDNLTYEDPPCTVINNQGGANCTNMNSINVLGLYSETGDVQFGFLNSAANNLNAPSRVRVDATIMTAQGSVEVEDYASGTLQDYITILGSVIQKEYGAFRLSGRSGYYRNFVYDQRMNTSFSPPNFPKASNTWVTFPSGQGPRGLWRIE